MASEGQQTHLLCDQSDTGGRLAIPKHSTVAEVAAVGRQEGPLKHCCRNPVGKVPEQPRASLG
jgi:hypothetical protein